MKTDILKFKAVVIALAIAATAHANTHTSDYHAIDIQSASRAAQTEEQFVESMFLQVRDTVKAIADLVESFIDKSNKESFSAFIGRCQDRLKHIENNILVPLREELSRVRVMNPGSIYHKTLELTFNLANDMAHQELKVLYEILDKHSKSPNAKKATALVGVLKPHLIKLTSVAKLDLLDSKLTEIYNLLVLEKHAAVTLELEKLKKIVKDIKTKTGTIQSKVDIELLSTIDARVKRP